MMHGHEKSDPAIVAVKPANKAEHLAASNPRANRGGVGGAKGGDQGECGPAKHAPDSEPGKRVTGAGSHTASNRRLRTRGGSRMRESRTYGSVRGARGNSRPYRYVRQPQAGAIQPVEVRPK